MLAYKIATGKELKPSDVDGGTKLNSQLIKLGFTITSDKLLNTLQPQKNHKENNACLEDKTQNYSEKDSAFTIDVVAFILFSDPRYSDLPINREEVVLNIINSSSADLIVFPGWTTKKLDIEHFMKLVKNIKSTVIFENYKPSAKRSANEMHIIEKGTLLRTDIRQSFTIAKEVNNNTEKVSDYVEELKDKRSFKLGEKNYLLISCGENNILKNKQSDGNNIVFRLKNPSIEKEFLKILKSTHVIVNSMHTKMGNQGKIAKRREFFSKNHKIYVSTSNIKWDNRKTKERLLSEKLIYVCKNGLEIPPFSTKMVAESDYILRSYLFD